MNSEERLRHLFRSAGPPPTVTDNDWSIFVHAAHRDRGRHRMTAMVAAAAVIAIAAGTFAVDRIGDQSLPPSGEVEPVILTDDVPQECPEAEPYEPASNLGAVAFVRDGDVYRADLQDGEMKLVETGNRYVEPDVQWSPDGRWISFGEGLVVRATGGAACEPLGEVSDAEWGAGDTLVGRRRARVFFGKPGGEAQEAHIDGRVTATPLVPDHGGRLVAFAAIDPDSRGRTQIWVLDLALERALLTHELPETDPFERPEIAGWSPDGQWIFYWETWQGSFPSESGSLTAIRRTPSPARIKVGRALYKDDLTWCEDTLIVVAPDDRLVKDGRRLVTAAAPDWTPLPVSNNVESVWSNPVCSPDGQSVAAATTPVYPKVSDRGRNISVHTVGRTHNENWGYSGDFETRNPVGWSSDGDWVMAELQSLGGGISLTLLDYGDRRTALQLNPVELGEEAEMLGTRAYDWYQP